MKSCFYMHTQNTQATYSSVSALIWGQHKASLHLVMGRVQFLPEGMLLYLGREQGDICLKLKKENWF